MGFKVSTLRFVVEEHLRRPFSGPVLTLGRQCIYATLDEVHHLLRAEGIEPQPLASDTDRYTNIPSWKNTEHAGFTSDKAFWTSLAGLDVEALDVSSHEDADHIADLNAPVPTELVGRYGLIIDGGTMEHIFDTRQALRNIVSMLKVGGRIIHFSPASNFLDHGFYQFSPTLFFDYYGTNEFADLACTLADQPDVDAVRDEWQFHEWRGLRTSADMSGPHPRIVIFQATKTAESTAYRIPQQGEHRLKGTRLHRVA